MTTTNDNVTKAHLPSCAPLPVGDRQARVLDHIERTDRSGRVWPRADWATGFDVHGGVARRYRAVDVDSDNTVALSQRAELTLGFDGTPTMAIDDAKISIYHDSNIGETWLSLPEARQLLTWMRSDQQDHRDLALLTGHISATKLPIFRAALAELLDAYDAIQGEEVQGPIVNEKHRMDAVSWAAPAWATSISYEGPACVDRDGVPYDVMQWFGLQRETENGYMSAEGCLDLDPETHTLTFGIDAPKLTYDVHGWPESPELSIEQARSLVAGESDTGLSDPETREAVREALRELLDAYDSAAPSGSRSGEAGSS